MYDESGNELSEKEIIKTALEHISEACAFLFETESSEGHAGAFMADNLLKYLQVIYRDDNLLDATVDYTAYEEKHYLRTKKHLELVT